MARGFEQRLHARALPEGRPPLELPGGHAAEDTDIPVPTRGTNADMMKGLSDDSGGEGNVNGRANWIFLRSCLWWRRNGE